MCRTRSGYFSCRSRFRIKAFDLVGTESPQRSIGSKFDGCGGNPTSYTLSRPLKFMAQRVNYQLPKTGAALHGRNFGPAQNVFGKIQGGTHKCGLLH
jgi:hypothetical protein